MAQDAYTGVQGVVTCAGATLAGAIFDFEVDRGTVSFPRSGKWSDLNKPGKVSAKGSIKRIQSNADLLMAAINGTPATGTATTLLATSTVLDASDFYQDMTDSTPGTASRIRVTLQTKNASVAGTVTLVGTDAGGNVISETIVIPATMVVDEYYTTQKVFLTVEGMMVRAVDTVDDLGTFKVHSIAGDASVNIGAPKEFALVGSVADGTNHITVTLANVWFNKAKFNFEDASKGLNDDLTFVITDPDADIAVTGADT